MGQTVSDMRAANDSVPIKEQLDFLVKVANFKLDEYQYEIEKSFTEPEYTAKRQVPGMRALRWARGYRVGTRWLDNDIWDAPGPVIPKEVIAHPTASLTPASTTKQPRSGKGKDSSSAREEGGESTTEDSPSTSDPIAEVASTLTDIAPLNSSPRAPVKKSDRQQPWARATLTEIDELITGFVGLNGRNLGDGEKAAINTLKSNIGRSLKYIIENQCAGEQEEEKFFVFMLNNAVVRIDIKIWKYNFQQQAAIAESHNVFCYTTCLSVVNHSQLRLDELVFLVSEYSGSPQSTTRYSEELTALWHGVNKMAISLPSSQIPRPPVGVPIGIGYPGSSALGPLGVPELLAGLPHIPSVTYRTN